MTLSHVAIRRALLGWFRRHALPLPWRKTKNAYHIWVSETMLQQTQIATVIPYYFRFLRAFPTVRHLARARRERVMSFWSGLGYYRRARDLHEAAKIVARRFGGKFPRTYVEARSLPGVGDYTARAVLSIAYHLPYSVVDGNVARVVARLGGIRGSRDQVRFRHAVDRELALLHSRRRPGDFNQALMELGQTLCLPRAPRCPLCPARRWCRAYRQGRPESYPSPRARRATERRHLATAIIRADGLVAMVRGLEEGLLGDLWNFPSAFGRSRHYALARLRKKLAGLVGSPFRLHTPFAEIKHGITHRSIRVHLYLADGFGKPQHSSLRWFRADRLSEAAVSRLALKIAQELGSLSPGTRARRQRVQHDTDRLPLLPRTTSGAALDAAPAT